MKDDAILINRARCGDRRRRTPKMRAAWRSDPSAAGLDVWWQEPARARLVPTRRPFSSSPTLLGSPHNSAITQGTLASAARDAAENVRRFLRGEPTRNLLDRSEYPDQP